MARKKVFILTGGGDCPGLNPAIKGFTIKAINNGREVYGIREGFQGLIDWNESSIEKLDREKVRRIERIGGTILATSRTDPYHNPKDIKKVLEALQELKPEALVILGGNGTMNIAYKLSLDKVPVIGVPKTIDKDVPGTDYTLGFNTAIKIITENIDILRTTAGSHKRTFIVEVMGRETGHLALVGGTAGGADIILIPEHKFDMGKVCQIIKEREQTGKRYNIVVVAEGAKPLGMDEEVKKYMSVDKFGYVHFGGIGSFIAKYINDHTGVETKYQPLGHIQRGGRPAGRDRRFGLFFGVAAMEAVLKGKLGTMVSYQQSKITLVPLKKGTGKISFVDVEKYYDTDTYNFNWNVLDKRIY